MIETERLILKPLTYEQLIKYTKCDNSLEKELNLNATSRTISPELKEAFEQTILPNVDNKTKNYLYSTLWTAISKIENKMVGDLCIIGEPSTDKTNIASYKVLEKNRFVKIEETEMLLNWKLQMNDEIDV